jgi:hypothetical protein
MLRRQGGEPWWERAAWRRRDSHGGLLRPPPVFRCAIFALSLEQLIARRPHGTLLRHIVLVGLCLRLGQLLVLDGTVMRALKVSRLGKRLLQAFCLWMTLPLDYLDLVSVEQ